MYDICIIFSYLILYNTVAQWQSGEYGLVASLVRIQSVLKVLLEIGSIKILLRTNRANLFILVWNKISTYCSYLERHVFICWSSQVVNGTTLVMQLVRYVSSNLTSSSKRIILQSLRKQKLCDLKFQYYIKLHSSKSRISTELQQQNLSQLYARMVLAVSISVFQTGGVSSSLTTCSIQPNEAMLVENP